ncbi:MAG: TolC family protein [Bacteroidales bacterium]
MKKIIWTIALIMIFCNQEINSQKNWTLGDCVTYAVSNNIQLRRQRLQTDNARVNLSKSRMDMLPDLNFESDGNVGFGRSIDPVTNLITFQENISNSYAISSSLNLFSGFTTLNTMAANKYMFEAGLESEKIVINTLVVNILGAYYQVLYAKGLENSARMQLAQSEKQLFRIKKDVEAGREAVSKQYEMESTASEDRLSLTVAINSTSQAVTSLKQILQLEPGREFNVQMPGMDSILITDESFRTDSIFRIASENLPRLKEINYELLASQKQVAAAKGAISPKLILGGSVYTGFYQVVGSAGQQSFSDQLRGNNSQAVYARLQIPLFNNYLTARNIKLARIRKNDTELRLELEKNTLYTEIENACLNYSRGKDEFAAAVSNFEFNKKSFDAVKKRFESGLVDVTDYSAASTNLFRAETEALRTKLQLMIRRLIIQFYASGDYKTIINN